MKPGRFDDRGAVTAEFAVALPAIVLVLALGLGALATGMTAVRLQQAVAESARLLGRGDDGRARAVMAQVGATFSVDRADALVCVEASVSAPVLIDRLSARSCALDGGG